MKQSAGWALGFVWWFTCAWGMTSGYDHRACVRHAYFMLSDEPVYECRGTICPLNGRTAGAMSRYRDGHIGSQTRRNEQCSPSILTRYLYPVPEFYDGKETPKHSTLTADLSSFSLGCPRIYMPAKSLYFPPTLTISLVFCPKPVELVPMPSSPT